MRSKKRVGWMVALMMVLTTSVMAGCGSPSDDSPDYADQAFLKAMGQGLEARWALTEKTDTTAKDYSEKKAFTSYVDAELGAVEGYTDKLFEDTKLQEFALQYINALKDQKEALEYYDSDYYGKFSDLWQAKYLERGKLISQINADYTIEINPKYQEYMDEVLSVGKVENAKDALEEQIQEMLDAGTFEKKENYGTYDCYLTVENTTGVDFASFEAIIKFYDSDGVMFEDSSDYAENWLKGDKIKFNFFASEAFDKYEITAGYYEEKK